MQELLAVMRRLRAPDGCPWDRRQTHRSLRRYLLEEAAEAVDAIAADEVEAMIDELGDVLLQVAFHAVIAEEGGRFDYRAIERALVAKLIRRHPHVFGDGAAADAAEVASNWQAIKAAERSGRPPTAADRVPRGLPALARAAALGEELGWSVSDEARATPLAALAERPGEIGAFLLAAALAARELGVDPELALREAIDAKARAEEGGP